MWEAAEVQGTDNLTAEVVAQSDFGMEGGKGIDHTKT
jgi:hypothetical protein